MTEAETKKEILDQSDWKRWNANRNCGVKLAGAWRFTSAVKKQQLIL